jgi:hypothetical protein
MYGFDLGFEFDSAKAVASFNPLSLSPSAWYDFSDLSTLFQDTAATSPVTADGQSVARVNDKSGNGRHLTQATAGFRPLYKTSGGLSWLESDGVDDVLKPATQFMTGSATASAVYASRNISVVAGAVLQGWGSSTFINYEPFSGDGHLYTDFGSVDRADLGVFGAGTTSPYVMVIERGATNLKATRSRTLVGSAATLPGWSAGIPSVANGNTRLYGLFIINRVLTAGETVSLENYMACASSPRRRFLPRRRPHSVRQSAFPITAPPM